MVERHISTKISKCEKCPIRKTPHSGVSDICGISGEVIPHHQVSRTNSYLYKDGTRGISEWREDITKFPSWCPLPLKLTKK